MPPGAIRRSTRLPRAHPPPVSGAQPTETTNHEVVAPVREVRKKTVNLFLKRYNKISDVKPRIIIEPGMTTPVGEWSQPFITEVNIICRQNAPLSCKDWRKLDRDLKRDLFHEPILNKFDIDLHLDDVEDAVNKYLGIRFRDFRSKLHKYYQNLGGTIAMKRSKPYEGVTQENWELICDRFEDPDFKEKSAKNKESRKAQVINHCAGSVSFARFKAKRGLGRIELYRQTHFSDKRLRWVAPQAQENHEAMVTHQAEAPTENSTPLNEDDIATQVLGTRPGYNRGLGHGFMPPSSGSRPNSVVDDLRRNVEEANRRLEDAERRNAESERRNEELRMQVQALQSWQAQMQSFISQFVPSASTRVE